MAGTSSEADPAMLEKLLVEGGTFIFTDVPSGTEFGIDMNTWNVGDKFKGVKMIPHGLHYMYYSAVSRQGDVAPRTGFFHFFKRRECIVKKWDRQAEDIIDVATDEDEVETTRKKKDYDRYLGKYPYESWRKWVSLTNYITESVVQRLVPLIGKINSVSELITEPTVADPGQQQRPSSSDDGYPGLPKMSPKPGTEIRFTKFPDKKYPDGSSAAEISRHNMDLSWTLDSMLLSMTSHDELLGELQFAFVCFLVGQVYDAFEQWKVLVNLFCCCDDAIVKHQDLFAKFVSVIYFQIGEVPQDFFVDIVSRNNFLTTTFQTFFSSANELEGLVSPQLFDRIEKFKSFLTKKFRWNFETEPDDYAPVVVENVTSTVHEIVAED